MSGKQSDQDRPLYMISVAADLAGVHPQTLRIYERRQLVSPQRSSGNTRLYSQADVERLRRIQQMTAEMGMNLAGVERVFELEQQLHAMTTKVRRLEKRAGDLAAEVERLEELRRSLRAEIVPYVRVGAIVPFERSPSALQPRFRIPVERPTQDGGGA